MRDTIFALATGAPPTAIAIVRVAGPGALAALDVLAAGRPRPPERQARLRRLYDPATGASLDDAMVLWFPAASAPAGAETVELHLHGSVAVIAGVLAALAAIPGLRPARAGDFARLAFASGRLDLAQVEALGDLAAAETPLQREQALAGLGGRLGRAAAAWRGVVLAALADAEAALDFAGEDPAIVDGEVTNPSVALRGLAGELRAALADDGRAARVRDGVTVAITGPPNAGKSSLLNALAGEPRAIVAATPGTTRDTVETRLLIAGVPVLLADTAGLRDTADPVEAEGIARARARVAAAELVLDLAPGARGDARVMAVESKIDLTATPPGVRDGRAHVSALTGAGVSALLAELSRRVAALLPGEPPLVAHARQRAAIGRAASALEQAADEPDPVLRAESLRDAQFAIGEVTGAVDVEAVLDAVFARFCIGK